MSRGLHYRNGHVAIPYREYPYRYVYTPLCVWWLRIRLYWLCHVLNLHHWHLSGDHGPSIKRRIICKRCGVWKDQEA
jgi:hypothetical protein